MQRTFDVLIDITAKRQNTLCIKRGDKGATYIHFNLMNNGEEMDMSTVEVATVKGVKPDKTIIYADATILRDEEGNKTNVIEYQLSEECATVAGRSTYELTLQDINLGIITSFEFYISVDNLLYDEDDYVSADDLSGFRAYMGRSLAAAEDTEAYVQAFRQAFGNEQDLLAQQQAEYEFYLEYINDLQNRVARGDFNGAPGAPGLPGEKGADGVISEIGAIVGFEVINGNLMMYGSDTDNWSINSDGELVMEY